MVLNYGAIAKSEWLQLKHIIFCYSKLHFSVSHLITRASNLFCVFFFLILKFFKTIRHSCQPVIIRCSESRLPFESKLATVKPELIPRPTSLYCFAGRVAWTRVKYGWQSDYLFLFLFFSLCYLILSSRMSYERRDHTRWVNYTVVMWVRHSRDEGVTSFFVSKPRCGVHSELEILIRTLLHWSRANKHRHYFCSTCFWSCWICIVCN